MSLNHLMAQQLAIQDLIILWSYYGKRFLVPLLKSQLNAIPAMACSNTDWDKTIQFSLNCVCSEFSTLWCSHGIKAAGSTAIKVTDTSTFCLMGWNDAVWVPFHWVGRICDASNHKEENVGGTQCRCTYNVCSFSADRKQNNQWFLVIQFYSKWLFIVSLEVLKWWSLRQNICYLWK